MTKRLVEVPFSFTISGTRLVVADDDAKGREIVEDTMEWNEDEARLRQSDLFWDKGDHIVLKDGVRVSRTIGAGTSFTGEPRDFEGQLTTQERIDLGIEEPRPHDEVLSTEPKQGAGKPFDENHDGIDKPGDDRLVGGNTEADRERRLAGTLPTDPGAGSMHDGQSRGPNAGPTDSKQLKEAGTTKPATTTSPQASTPPKK